jgi:hypothetical protein
VQKIIAEILLSVRKLNDNWVALAAQLYDLPERDIALGGDSLSLATLIHITRQYVRSEYFDWDVLRALSKLDIGNTLPRLQHDFCTLWNEVHQEARNKGYDSRPVYFLRRIRHLYIALHQGTDAAPTVKIMGRESENEKFNYITRGPFWPPFVPTRYKYTTVIGVMINKQ